MKKQFINKKLITCGMTALLIGTMLTGKTMATETKDYTKYPNDVTPPWGRVVIEGGTQLNNISYVDDQNVTVKAYASDDKCAVEEISFYVSTSSLTSTNIPDNAWKSLKDGNTAEITLPGTNTAYTIYACFKDYNGNTSVISTVTNQTITYNLNGGTYNGSTENLTGVDTTRYHGAPYVITERMPKKDKVFFLGWSTDPTATEASYHAGDTILPEMVIGESSSATLYAVYTTEAVGYVKLSEVVEVGDYVNYPVDYSNVATSGTSYIAKFNGWRVLSVEDDGTVNLVSAGVPLTYYHGTNTSTSITNLAINFLETAVTTSNEGYRLNGFDPSKTLTESFTNKYTATYETDTSVSYPGYNTTLTGTKLAGTPKVRSLTKEDIDTIYGEATAGGTSLTSEKFNYLFAVPATSNYAYTLLASADGSRYLWGVSRYGIVYDSDNNTTSGVRPVVSLKSEVLAVDKDAIGAWNITISE